MRKLFFLSLAAGLTFAQLPRDTLRTRIHAPTPSNGARVALISQLLNWSDPETGQLVPVEPAHWTLDNGWRLEGGPVKTRIVRGATLKLTDTGFDLSADVAVRQGARTYSFPQAARLLDLTVDPSTGELTGNGFRLSRAVRRCQKIAGSASKADGTVCPRCCRRTCTLVGLAVSPARPFFDTFYHCGTHLLKLRHSQPTGSRCFGPARVAHPAVHPGLSFKTADRFSLISSASSARTIP